MRPDKTTYFLGIAEAVSKRSTCLRRQYGAVIVKDDRIISTGYNGSPVGEDNCCDCGYCWREAHKIPHGERYEECLSGATRIRLLNGTSPTIAELADENPNEIFVYSVDSDGHIVPARAINVRKTGRRSDMCRVTFDDDTFVECTVDHPVLLRNLTYCLAGELKVGSSVMPYYGDKDYISNTWREREFKPTKKERDEWTKTCRTSKTPCMDLVYDYYHGHDDGLYGKNSNLVIHHSDGNHQNNSPDNLKLISRVEHSSYHVNERGSSLNREASLKGVQTQRMMLEEDPDFKKRKVECGRNNMAANWADFDWREHALERCRENFRVGREKSNRDPNAIANRCRSKIIAGISSLYFQIGRKDVSPEEYESIRNSNIVLGRGGIKPPTVETILKYFDSLDDALELGRTYNHKVKMVEYFSEATDVYDMEVPEFHNFAVDLGNNSGVFVHNCVAVHAEQNAILQASGIDMKGATLYLYGAENGERIKAEPCKICGRFIKNAGLTVVS